VGGAVGRGPRGPSVDGFPTVHVMRGRKSAIAPLKFERLSSIALDAWATEACLFSEVAPSSPIESARGVSFPLMSMRIQIATLPSRKSSMAGIRLRATDGAQKTSRRSIAEGRRGSCGFHDRLWLD